MPELQALLQQEGDLLRLLVDGRLGRDHAAVLLVHRRVLDDLLGREQGANLVRCKLSLALLARATCGVMECHHMLHKQSPGEWGFTGEVTLKTTSD